MGGAAALYDPQQAALSRALAEYVGEQAPTWVLQAFAAACLDPSAVTVHASLRAVELWAHGSGGDLAKILAGLANLVLQEIAPGVGSDHPYSFGRFLPDPDEGPSGKPMWMIPGLSSFTNIVARLNLARERRMGSVTLVHDAQRYTERAIRDGRSALEALALGGGTPPVPFADYAIEESPTFDFRLSDQEIGLQVADVVAGLVVRHLKGAAEAPSAPRSLQRGFDAILAGTDPQRGHGINCVATNRLLSAAGVRTFPR